MTWWQAIILGLVEGLTEYLPVSSTGHLLVVQALLGIGTADEEAKHAADAYAICIQAGAILAVLGLYRQRVAQAARGWAGRLGLGPGDEAGYRLGLNLLIAFIPAAIVGVAFNDHIEDNLFGVWPVVIAWFVGGVAILATVFWRRRKATGGEKLGIDVDGLTWHLALSIGLIQCMAMWPGTSRSLVTIVGGLALGMSVAGAVEFSFLLGVITLCAATLYKALLSDMMVTMPDGGAVEMNTLLAMEHHYGWANMVLGSLAAWASAVAAVTWMVAYLKKHGMELFGYYRIAVALIVAAMVWRGWLAA
jgi:undecaprenyl-diphosphatase